MCSPRDPRAAAQAVVGDEYDARVLEPSPPADTSEAFADDPPAAGARRPGTTLLTPADDSWHKWVAEHPEHADWAAERWLAAYRRLEAPPDDLAETRDRLHLLLTNVITPARYRATGKIAVRWARGGFGTPFFLDDVGRDTQVRVDGDEVVVQHGDTVDERALTTLGAAANGVLGDPEPDMQWTRDLDLHDVPPTGDVSDELRVPADTVRFLGDWFGFAYAVLERFRADDASTEASRPQLWPEHFDPALEVLAQPLRASYGFSPGDGAIPEPYAYVAVWDADAAGITTGSGLWNADDYPGAVLPLRDLLDVDDQFEHALGWLRTRRDALAAT